MTLSHILVPYDGTEQSDQAFEEALKLTKKYSCALSVVTCFRQSYQLMIGYADYILDENSISSKKKNLKKKAKNENVSYSHYIIDSERIVDTILAFADEHDVDMIIMGSQKKPGIMKKIYQGSISKEIKKHAKCIVKII